MPGGDVTAILKTTDVSGTLDWYRRIGFEVGGVFQMTSPRGARHPEAGVRVPRWRDAVGDLLHSRNPLFHSQGVDAFFEQIKEHTTPAWGPEDRDWGTRAGLQDPNGYSHSRSFAAPST
jgi:hypothetical protein